MVSISNKECVVWPFQKDDGGYGGIRVGGGFRKAHRVFYEMFNGPIPEGMHVLHVCDNPGCVNPNHLRLGTHKDNMADKHAKGRYPHGSAAVGAKLTEEKVRKIQAELGTLREIAERYGVSKSVVHSIKTGKAWRHVTCK